MDALSGQMRAAIDLANNVSPEGSLAFPAERKGAATLLRFSSSMPLLADELKFALRRLSPCLAFVFRDPPLATRLAGF